MDQPGDDRFVRIPVGTHFRVWWFWLPLIVAIFGLLTSSILLPVAPLLAAAAGGGALLFGVWTFLAAVIVLRGRRWVEFDEAIIRVTDVEGTTEFRDDQLTDLAVFRVMHHAGGRFVAYSREVRLWVDTGQAQSRLRWTNRLPPLGADPLEELISRLQRRLLYRAADRLARGLRIDGDQWELDERSLRIQTNGQAVTLDVASICAFETVGQEVRIWREGVPRAVVRLPLSGRNTWMIERLLSAIPRERPAVAEAPHSAPRSHPLGRILFERRTGPVVSILFASVGILIALVSLLVIGLSLRAAEPMGMVVGVLLASVGGLCLLAGLRVRRVHFCCHEHGLERVTMTGRQVLRYSEIDAFSFEARRNHSHGRYTGTTYTLVFADRSREQGRGIFFSTTVHNTDEELEMLRDRVSEQIARRLAAAFALSRRVQWTPELWFHEDVLEYSRPRRLLSGPKLTVVPYDAVTDFDIRDGTFYLWTNYQERAVIRVKTSSANFFPGLIVLESLVNAHVPQPASEWSSSAQAS